MVGQFVTMNYPAGADRERVRKVAADSQGMFTGMPGLHWKFYTFDEAAGRATNFYVWESREAAEGFFTDEVRALVTELYGVEPTVSIVELVQLVDNTAGAAVS